MILEHLGKRAEAYFIDMAYGLLIVSKGERHYAFYSDIKHFRVFETTAHEQARWTQITEKEAWERLALNDYQEDEQC